MKIVLVLTIAFCACVARAYADAKIVCLNNAPIRVTLRSCDKDGYDLISEVGIGKEVVIPASIIAKYRGDVARGQLPAICLVIELATPLKKKNGDEEDGWYPCQIRDGIKAAYYVNLDAGSRELDSNYGTYP